MYGDDPKTEQPPSHLNNVLLIGLLAAGAWWAIPKLGRKYGTGWEEEVEANKSSYGRLSHGQRDDDEDCGCGG